MEKISTKNAPAAIGPYSQGMKTGGLVFNSGQIPLDPETGKTVGSGIKEQAARAIANLEAVLVSGGSSLDNVVKTTCFLKNMSDCAEFNEVYATFFKNAPARSCVEVSCLPKGVLVEIEAVAVLPEV